MHFWIMNKFKALISQNTITEVLVVQMNSYIFLVRASWQYAFGLRMNTDAMTAVHNRVKGLKKQSVGFDLRLDLLLLFCRCKGSQLTKATLFMIVMDLHWSGTKHKTRVLQGQPNRLLYSMCLSTTGCNLQRSRKNNTTHSPFSFLAQVRSVVIFCSNPTWIQLDSAWCTPCLDSTGQLDMWCISWPSYWIIWPAIEEEAGVAGSGETGGGTELVWELPPVELCQLYQQCTSRQTSRADDKNLEQLGKEGQVNRTGGKGVMGPVTPTRWTLANIPVHFHFMQAIRWKKHLLPMVTHNCTPASRGVQL